MTTSEFEQWWQDFCERFPDMGDVWFAENRQPPAQKELLRRWCDALFDVTLPEALAVNLGMYRGDLESFKGKWDRDRIPAILRQHAIAARPAPTTWSGPDLDLEPEPVKSASGLNGALHELITMRASGASDQDCTAFLRQRFPPEPLDRQRRYTCIQCFDIGRVEVWHWERVYLARDKGIDAALACKYQTATMACACKAGSSFVTRKIPLPQFNDQKHCLAVDGDVSSEKAVYAFVDWLATCKDVSRNKNYEPGFAAYSQREAF